MVQAAEGQRSPLDRVLTMQPTPRVDRPRRLPLVT